MLEPIKYENEILIEGIPKQWLPMIKLFDPYLPQYPIMYVHIKNSERIYGFPINYNIKKEKAGKLDISFLFLSNKKLDKKSIDIVKTELMERIGLKNKVTLKDIEQGSKKDEHKKYLMKLWKFFINKTYGGELPFGKFYEPFLSIIRCSAAFNPMSGAKSEWQMLYDFVRYYGEEIKICDEYSYLEFYLLPTYEEIVDNKISEDFQNFFNLLSSVEKIGNLLYEEIAIDDLKMFSFKGMTSNTEGFDLRKGPQFRSYTSYLLKKGKISSTDKKMLDFLVDAFNRMPTRALGFVTIMFNTIKGVNFNTWKKEEIDSLYLNRKKTKMIYPKIIGMILQQGFGNEDAVPIDNWINSIYEEPLQIKSEEEFLSLFEKVGKIERLFWLVSQARKTNMKIVFDILWCIKYGTGASTQRITGDKDKRLKRGPNPLSCLDCNLKNECSGFNFIKNEKIKFIELKGKKAPKETEINEKFDWMFLVFTQNNIPKFVYKKIKNKWSLVDAFTGYEIHEKKVSGNKIKSVNEFIKSN